MNLYCTLNSKSGSLKRCNEQIHADSPARYAHNVYKEFIV